MSEADARTGPAEAVGANVARFLPWQAAAQPAGLAVRLPVGRTGGRIDYDDLTFSALEREAGAAALLAQRAGIDRGTRVLLMVRPGRDLIVLVFALFRLGAVPVVIDPGLGLRPFLRSVRRTVPTALVGVPLAQRLSRLFFPSFRAVRSRLTPGSGGYARALADARREVERNGAPLTVPARADELAAILFTSGSTGPAKGVCYEHGQFDGQVRLIREQYGIEPGEVDLPMLPVFALFNPALGMTTVVPEMDPSRPARVDPAKIVQAIHQCGVTNTFGSPVLWTKIGAWCEARGETLPSVRRILMAGAPVSPALHRTWRNLLPNGIVHTPYGATECLPVTTISGPEVLAETAAATAAGAGTCVGRALPGVSVRILPVVDGPRPAGDLDRPLATGAIGEIVVTGPTVTRSYDALPEATAAAKLVTAAGVTWHRMGDLGRLDEEGRLWFQGRQAERVRLAEGDLYTDPVEAIFNQHPDVARTALLAVGLPGAARPVLAVEPKPSCWPRSAAARQAFATALAALAQPAWPAALGREFAFVKAFPVDVRHNAKIHRLSLALAVAAGRLKTVVVKTD